MSARHYIVGFLMVVVGTLGVTVYAEQKAGAPASPAVAASPQCQSQDTEINILRQELNNYRTQVARLATAIEGYRAKETAAQKPTKE